MSTAYDKLLTTLGLTDEQFKLTYGTVEDLPWRTMSEDVQQLRTEYMGYSDDLVTARREVENYTAAVEQDQEAINASEAEYQEASAAVECLNASQQSAATAQTMLQRSSRMWRMPSLMQSFGFRTSLQPTRMPMMKPTAASAASMRCGILRKRSFRPPYIHQQCTAKPDHLLGQLQPEPRKAERTGG